MQKITVLSLLALMLACNPASEEKSISFPQGEWVDLTYAYDENTIFWPTSEPFRLDTVFAGMAEGGYYYTAFKFCLAEHGGTHLDAPIHFAEGKWGGRNSAG